MGNLEILYQAALYGMGNMQINKKNYFLKQILNFYQLTLKQGHMFTLTLSVPKKLKNSTLKYPCRRYVHKLIFSFIKGEEIRPGKLNFL